MAVLHRHWKIHLIHHTHLDIGYTDAQDAVLVRQFHHLERAMDLVEANMNKPEAARFRWNPEITWAILPWYNQTSDKNRLRFINMVKQGYIGLDGLYGNLLTGLCRPEELMENFRVKSQIEAMTDTKIDSAMITDVPGWIWGFVTALAENGIRYLSAGPNRSDRIGYSIKKWGDRPFYWVSPSKKEKVLLYTHGKGYSWFHDAMHRDSNLKNKLTPHRIKTYLKSLENSGYPYDTLIIRYNIGADNGPPDSHLSDIVEQWNQDHADIKICLSTTSQAMSDFEKDYGHLLPEYAGDMTPYWEDGAASTARETSLARQSAEALVQSRTLDSMLQSDPENVADINEGWQNVLLFSEHTWGAYNSVTKPDDPFATRQWVWKQNCALHSQKNAETVLNRLLNRSQSKDAKEIIVYNTQSWPVSNLVEVQTDYTMIYDENDNEILSQKLSNGHRIFLAKDVPCLSSKVYHLADGVSHLNLKGCLFQDMTLSNALIRFQIDPQTGQIVHLYADDQEMIKQNTIEKFNAYLYAAGKRGGKIVREDTDDPVQIKVLENGPLLAKIQVQRHGYHCKTLTTEYTVYADRNDIEVMNHLDRPSIRKKEAIFFEFPFDLPNGHIRYDVGWGSALLDDDQMIGANKNFITATRWLDLSDSQHGVSIIMPDSPMFKSGAPIKDPFRSGPPKLCGWKDAGMYNGTVYAYVMNNYWMTNYKADQPGMASFRYIIRPHKAFSEADTQRFALEITQPLLMGFDTSKSAIGILSINNPSIVVTSLKTTDGGYDVRLFNCNDAEEIGLITWSNKGTMSITSPNKAFVLADNTLTLSAMETVAIHFSL